MDADLARGVATFATQLADRLDCEDMPPVLRLQVRWELQRSYVHLRKLLDQVAQVIATVATEGHDDA